MAIFKLTSALPLMLGLTWFCTGCGSSSGGAPASASAPGTKAASDGQAHATPTPAANPVVPLKGSVPPAKTAGDAAPPATAGADPTDEEVCSFISGQGAVIQQHFALASQFLCQKGGLASLRAAAGTLKTLANSTDSSGVSTFALASASLASGTPTGAKKLTDLFCTSFDSYKNAIGADAFTNIASITPENAAGDGCGFDFKATAILFIQPEYKGQQQFVLNSDQSLGMGVSYLTQAVSTVVDSTTLSLAVKSKGQLYLYTVLTSVAPTSGFASTVYQDLLAGTTASLQGAAKAIATLSK